MKVFRLVLVLAGLAIYLVVKQFLHSDQTPRGSTFPGRSGIVPGAQQTVPRTERPQTKPHIELLKPETSLVQAQN